MEQLPESAAEGLGMQGTRSSEFGSRLQHAGHNHGQYQIEIAAGMGMDQLAKLQSVPGAENSGHMAMRARADDIESLWQRSGEGKIAFQDGTERLHLS